MTKICIIADTHRRHRELAIPPCDLLIHCGDFCSFQREDSKTLEDVDQWFAESPASHVVCIGGNHDFLLQNREFRFAHATYLQDELVEVAGLKIYGTPWCPDLSGFAFYAPLQQLEERWKCIPSDIDILVTHTPPYGILDFPTTGSPHLGCTALRQELNRICPRLHVFGHVHASFGRTNVEQTEFINAAVVGGPQLNIRNSPTLLHWG